MTTLLIDGDNWFTQCFYAGPTQCGISFMRKLVTLLDQVPHTDAVVCWDAGRSFRMGLSSRYKSARTRRPDEFYNRLAKARELADSHVGLHTASLAGYDAADCIASLAAVARADQRRAIVFAADKELHQILEAGSVTQVTTVARITTSRLAFHTMTAEALVRKYGVQPAQWLDYRAIVGDKTDGIPGCPGVGATAASQVLKHCGSLDAFFRKPFDAPVSNQQRAKLMAWRPELAGARELLRLRRDLPLSLHAEAGDHSP